MQKRTPFTFKGQKTHFIHSQKPEKKNNCNKRTELTATSLAGTKINGPTRPEILVATVSANVNYLEKNVTLTRDVSCGGGVAHGAVHYLSERPARGHAAAQAGLLELKNNNDCRTRLCCLHSTHKMPRNPHAAEPTPEPINASTNTAV